MVYQRTQQGWPHQRRHVPRLARRYWDFRDELSTDDGMLLKGPRLIIPGELQEEYLSRLHEGHLSANKVQENAKQHMYWTGIDADIEDYTKRCQECIKRSQVPKEPLQPHDIPEGPWRKLGMDYFAFDGSSYVLICDYFSKFPFLYRAKTSFWSLRDRLIDLFSIEGYPDEIVSDNGPPFQSKEFAKFLSGLGIKHTTSSPGYPRSNGFIERHIQTVKTMLSKSSNTRSFQEVLADLRTTRIRVGLPSPAEILHGRNLTTRAQAEIDIKAIVFACQRFSTYLLGRSFVAESDHKPLEMIAMKNLANAPPRLQRMLLELQRYDVTIKYQPGKEMQLADALSRCPARASQEIKLDMRVDYIAFTKPWIEKLKDSTQRDPILATVYQLTQQGWPHQRRHVP